MKRDIDRSYAYCRQVVRRSSSNLAWCFWLLPADQRRGMDALYAFARQADDLVDRNLPAQQRQTELDNFRGDLSAALAGEPAPQLMVAVADTVQRFNIAPKLLHHLLDGMADDLTAQVPATFAELRAYCYRAASAIGLACLPVWGCTDERATPPAIDCGIAFQLTNILRDLREDAQRGRCYLPFDELKRFGLVSPLQVDQPWTPELAELIEFQIARARSHYESAAETARYLPPPGRRVFALMLARYRLILAAIQGDPSRVLRERIAPSWPRKFVAAVGALRSSWPKVQSPDPASKSTLHLELGRAAQPTAGFPRVAIVGGGLAGLAAAVALCQRGLHVELFESRHKLGGRAGSYVDQESGELIDHCQHVAMGCCTTFLDFCRQTKIDGLLTRHRRLHFFGPRGERCDFDRSGWLPPPLHLGAALWGQKYLSAADRISIAAALLRLARLSAADDANGVTVNAWLSQQRQSSAAIEHFWQVVLVSALGETLERASLAAARKVFVDGFLGNRSSYEVWTPKVSLEELYDVGVANWLRKRGVAIHLGSTVSQIVERNESPSTLALLCKNGSQYEFDVVIAALPWRRLPEVLSAELAAKLPTVVSAAKAIQASPITGIHLWFDRPIMDLPHAVLVGRLAQWVFAKCKEEGSECKGGTPHYYQVVISASRNLMGRERDEVVREVLADLQSVLPHCREAKLLRWQMITDQESVFSAKPGLSQIRPLQRTGVPGLFLAGDWTATGWPSTMEGAVRSGYLAAEELLVNLGRSQRIVPAGLPRSWLARLLVRDR